MASVHLAIDERLGRRVAVKILRPDLAKDEAFVARFRREARLSATADEHPNIVKVIDFQDTSHGGKELFLVMEYVEGRTLRDQLSETGAMTIREATRTTLALLDALAAAHRAGLVHRDVKPENVLIHHDGKIKVTDFGLARAVTSSTRTSTTGVLLGTVSYLAPEQLDGDRADERSDVYAVGLILYELLTGQKAFQGQNPMHVAYQHVHGPVPRASDRVATVPFELERVIAHAAAKDPRRRPADASEMARELRASLELLSDEELDAEPELIGAAPPPDPEPAAAAEAGPEPAIDTTPVPPESSAPDVAAEDAPDAAAEDAPDAGAQTQPGAETDVLVQHDPAGSGADTNAAEEAPTGDDATGNSAAGDNTASASATAIMSTQSPEQTVGLPAQTERLSVADPVTVDPSPIIHEPERRRKWLWPLVSVLAVVIGGGAFWFTFLGPGSARTVPPLKHLLLADAEAALDQVGLSATVTEDFSETEPVGQVVDSAPTSGTEVRRGDAITLVVSKGPERYAVPQLDGKTRADAEQSLAQQKLAVGTVAEEYSEDVPDGTVISQDPPADTRVKRDTTVDLVVSKGREPIPVPLVKGKTVKEATQLIEEARLVIAVEEAVHSDTVPDGQIISQDPADGTLFIGDTVTVLPSKGPVLVTVPRTIGMQKGPATNLLQGLGLKVAYDNVLGGVFGTVRRSNPRAGTLVSKGSTVTLTIV
ncbi:MAG: serine/threonine protein kinase [Actinomycetales bacterium]|nr:MAG: serine/threonine protein kinase [Actinomycetales bacterium]